jgi:putative ABC transport system permease protein
VKDFAGIEAATRLRAEGTFLVSRGTQRFKEGGVLFADANFFETFSVPLLKGNPKAVLTEPNTVVITKKTALKYFGQQDPVGQTLTMGTLGLFRVTGVCEEVPANTHFRFDFLGSFPSVYRPAERPYWLTSGAYTYLVLREGYSIEDLRAKNAAIVTKYIGPEIQQFMGISLSEYLRQGNQYGFAFQPLTQIHLHSDLEEELEANGESKYVYIFSAIAGFILLLASINFMNLSTASSAGRAKEVGVRKVLGSRKGQLVSQFLTESVLLTMVSLGMALGLVAVLLPGFNQLSGKQFDLSFLLQGGMVPGILLTGILIGLLAGSYPAFLLSSFRPVSVLKGKWQAGSKSSWLRDTLVTVQFVVSISLIISTIVVYGQLRFMQQKKLGVDKEQVLLLHDTYVLEGQTQAFKADLKKLTQVESVTLAGYVPAGASNSGVDGFQPDRGTVQPETYRFSTYRIDEEYLPTLGIKLAQGRNFSKAFPTDTAAVLINQAAAREFGWKNPIGQRIATLGNGQPESKRTYTIIGVIKDFHFQSMRQRISPLVMYLGGDNYQMALRIRTDRVPELLQSLAQTWQTYTDTPFSYSFLNDRFNQMYQSEQRTGRLIGIFAGLAVLIASLGLFGLSAYTAHQRTKEIGIRKVLGASVSSIIALLAKDFLKLVLLAILLASPLAWYFMQHWLADFAYRIGISWWVFALAGLLAIAIALLTVSVQSIKAALVNPVKSLRSE